MNQCEECEWNDGGECMCGHITIPYDCPDFELKEDDY